MTTKPTTLASNDKLKNTLLDLKLALDEWDQIKAEEITDPALDIRKKTREILQQLNEQMKELDL